MEVHHHSHTSRKKWTHYFWEFLMLFLAVTLGFFVENQREHYIERVRAKEYARLLTDDLAADIGEFNRTERVLNKIITAGDSLARILNIPDIRKVPGGKIYYYEYWSGWRWSVISRDATLQQLKNSGSLRYLRNTSFVRKILDSEDQLLKLAAWSCEARHQDAGIREQRNTAAQELTDLNARLGEVFDAIAWVNERHAKQCQSCQSRKTNRNTKSRLSWLRT